MAKFDTQSYRDANDQLRSRFQKLYVQRMPQLRQYENMVNTTLHDLLSQTLPQAANMFAESNKIGEAYTGDFLPASQRYLQSAEGYDTPERRMAASGRAMSDVETAGEASRQAALDNLESYGIDPSQTRGAALDQNVRLQTALEAVRAGNEASRNVEETGRRYVSDAIDKGAALPGAQVGMTGAAHGMLTSGVNAANQVFQTGANVFGTPTQNLTAQQNIIQANEAMKLEEANFKQTKSAQHAAGVAGGMAGIGQLAGTVAGGALGFAATGGNPFGAMYGAQMGSQLGGSAGGAGGGITAGMIYK
jgi:hypothetical protein